MSWVHPEWLWTLPLLVIWGVWLWKRGDGRLAERLLLVSSLTLLILALAHPWLPEVRKEAGSFGTDVMIALDVSHSMSATDIAPSRFDAAKTMAEALLDIPSANRYTMAAFTTNLLPLSPLSLDRAFLKVVLEGVERENILTRSTNLMAVLNGAVRILPGKEKPVVIFSDGGDSRNFSKELAYAKEHGIRIYFVPVATKDGAKLYDRYGNLMRDEAKRMVISARNPHVSVLAEGSGGAYLESYNPDHLLELLARHAVYTKGEGSQSGVHLFMPLILGSFLLFMLTTVRIKGIWLLPVMLLIPGPAEAGVLAAWYEYRGVQAYETGAYKEAAEAFESQAVHSEDYRVAFNLANAYYQLGRFDEAILLYEAIRSDDPLFKSEVYYNLGNAYARKEEFAKASQMYLNSLRLHYTKEADRNRRLMAHAKKGYKPDDSMAKKGEGEKKKGKPPKSEPKPNRAQEKASKTIDLSKQEREMIKKAGEGKRPLNSSQYQMINQREGTSEENPW